YILRKKIPHLGLVVDDQNRIFVAMTNAQGKVVGGQVIEADGSKKFLCGTPLAGSFYLVNGETANAAKALVGEGLATMLSAREATNSTAVVAFCKNNLLAVAKLFRTKYPHAEIIIIGDNDRDGGGQQKAIEAAEAVNAAVAIPEVPGWDWNDVHVQQGLDAVKAGIELNVCPSTVHFDVETLPPVLREFAETLAKSLPVAVDLPAVAALVVAGAAIGASRFIELKPGWVEHVGLYCALVAPTGSLKTPVLQKVVAPLTALQSKWAAEHETKLRAYEDVELAQYRIDLKQFESGKITAAPSKPLPPIQRRTTTSDTTVERLAGLLKENPKGIAIVRDELSAWVGSMNQYRGGRGADREFFLSAYSAFMLTVDRQAKPPLIVEHPFLSVVGNIPPDVLPELSHEASREDGFVHRLIFSCPASVSVRWTEYAVPDETMTAYRTRIEDLFALRDGEVANPLAHGTGAHYVLHMARSALHGDGTARPPARAARVLRQVQRGLCAVGTNPCARRGPHGHPGAREISCSRLRSHWLFHRTGQKDSTLAPSPSHSDPR
ncbi:MAG: DUF3987 domain-containing protein, partial [Nitrospira sp.]|nr:DUF3987 domain-containing protein [Nitrospira sp.]